MGVCGNICMVRELLNKEFVCGSHSPSPKERLLVCHASLFSLTHLLWIHSFREVTVQRLSVSDGQVLCCLYDILGCQQAAAAACFSAQMLRGSKHKAVLL